MDTIKIVFFFKLCVVTGTTTLQDVLLLFWYFGNAPTTSANPTFLQDNTALI
jgi:hypothetical protein